MTVIVSRSICLVYVILLSLLYFSNGAPPSSSPSSSFKFGGIYSTAAKKASNEIAEHEQRRRKTQAHRREETCSEGRRKTMEEAIESAKQMPLVLGGESSDTEASQEEPPMTTFSDTENDDEDFPAISMDDILDHEGREMKDVRKKRGFKKMKRRKKHVDFEIDNDQLPCEPSGHVPTQAPTEYQEESTSIQPSDDLRRDKLIGQVVLSKFRITEKLRIGSTKSELFKCYHIGDDDKRFPLVMKLSQNTNQIHLEHRIFLDLFSRLESADLNLFVRVYDLVEIDQKSGFIMDCGIENLRGYLWRYGPLKGESLRKAMKTVIGIVNALHQLGTVWTEVKAENLIVFDSDIDGSITIKAVDLESVAAKGEYLRAYTAETYPPEFPAESLYNSIPQIPLDYKFDVWGLGLVLFEIAVGEPLFTLQKTYDVEYIKERLRDSAGIVEEATLKLRNVGVDPGARNVIEQCLVVDPTKRTSCERLLKNDYFLYPPTIQKQ